MKIKRTTVSNTKHYKKLSTQVHIQPEEENKLIITSWLNENGIQVYWEKKNQFNYPTFKTKGTQRKPDLLFFSNILNEWIAAEAKQPNGKDIRQSQKIINYLEEAANQTTTYYIDDKQIEPSIFLCLTKHSKTGHLFDNEQVHKETDKDIAKIYGVPQIEYTRTHDFYRTLISNWNTPDQRYSLGVLLSHDNKPYVMFKRYNIVKKRWWGHRFWAV